MKRIGLFFSTVIAAVLLTAGSCESPCVKLAPPTPAEIAAAAQGSEIEREVGYAECVVVGNGWQQDND